MNTPYDSGCNDQCSHEDFKKNKIVNGISKYANSAIFRPCCDMGEDTKHGYLYGDDCEVSYFVRFR